MENMNEKVYAKDLRKKENLLKIPDKPGLYKWWASQKALEELLNYNKINLDKDYINSIIENLTTYETIDGEKYYYVYVGIAVNESVRKRIDWHINQHHTPSAVNSGFLSTLRKSISSLIVQDQFNESKTNELIDMLKVEYITIDSKIHSLEAKEKLHSKENEEMKNNVLPLNIKGNKNEKLKEYKKQLMKLRKEAKNEKNVKK